MRSHRGCSAAAAPATPDHRARAATPADPLRSRSCPILTRQPHAERIGVPPRPPCPDNTHSSSVAAVAGRCRSPRAALRRPSAHGAPVQEWQEQQRRERARAELSWKLQPRGSGSPALVHRGSCAAYGAQMGFLNREEAIIAMNEPDIEPCQICNPQTGLV
ncbi:DUF6233 domain-containing protein [Streptomyces sp. NBC_00623]|uniref:DUF6233 domain-containing protein n=1 Tax=Streptomyces sp. NBC_00623 TaxID=2975790 RepID=UPI0030E4E89F